MQEQMIEIRDVRLSEVQEGSELDSDTDEEIYSQVLSSERYEKYGFKRDISPVLRNAPQARKSRGSGYEKLQNEFQENKRRMSDMEILMKQTTGVYLKATSIDKSAIRSS